MEPHRLTDEELLALAASARLMMRVDGELSEAELDYLEPLGASVGLSGDRWRRLWDQAIRRLPDTRALRAAAAVTRPEAREVIYEHLYRLADRDGLTDAEWDVLEWLDETWYPPAST